MEKENKINDILGINQIKKQIKNLKKNLDKRTKEFPEEQWEYNSVWERILMNKSNFELKLKTMLETLKICEDKILEIIDKELLEFGCVKEDFKRKDLDSFPQPICSILRLRKKIVGGLKNE